MIRKYVFNRSFDDADYLEGVRKSSDGRPGVPEKTFEDGFQQGFQKGLESRAQDREEKILGILKQVEDFFKALSERSREQKCQVLKLSVSFAKGIVKKVFPSLSGHKGLAEDDLEQKLLPLIKDFSECRVKVFVHKSMAGFIESRLRGVTGVFFDVEIDEQLNPGDCRLYWNESGFESLRERLNDEVFALLDEMVTIK